MYSDYHIHSNFSTDSNELPKNIIKTAIALNMSSICFTDHQDFNWPIKGKNFDLDVDSYFGTLIPFKERYSKYIDINIGVECGLMEGCEQLNHDLILHNPFDFVIGSCHIIDKMDPYYSDFWNGKQDRDAFEHYFITLNNLISKSCDFDVLGHIDYIVRYSPNKNANYSALDYINIIDEILTKIIRCGKGIEVNSSGYKAGLSNPNPCYEILKRYKELGGEIITFGSDAHQSEFIGYEFEKTAHLLRQCDFRYYCTFSKRTPEFIKL